MTFRLGFAGTTNPELDHLLQAVERRLNGHGLLGQVGGETGASLTASAASGCEPGSKVCENSTHGGHDPLIIIGVAVVAAAAGAAAGYAAGKKAGSSS